MAFLDPVLNPVFMPLLRLPSIIAIGIISFILTLILTLIYKRFTDQSLMKSLKGEIKGYQDEMKKHSADPQKVLKIQKKAMDANLKYMTHSFKPTLITMIPILFIFGWLNAHFIYQPLVQDTDFFVTATFDASAAGNMTLNAPKEFTLSNDATQQISNGMIEWKMKAPAGEYVLGYDYDLRTFSQPIRINADASDRLYEDPILAKNMLVEQGLAKEDKLKSIVVGNKRIRPFGSLSIFGWHPGWLATYIIFSILFSIGMRKVLDVY
jgi:uncharacterized membrane protein (DUF106 family)